MRVLAATNKRPRVRGQAKAVSARTCIFRLNVVPILSPPLRERRSDILLLAQGFLREFSVENGLREKPIDDDVLEALGERSWPGNVRELRNVVERMAILSGDRITLDDLPEEGVLGEVRRESSSPSGRPATLDDAGGRLTLRETERISLGHGGGQSDGHSREASITEDGRFVAFYSSATNLVPDDTNGKWDGFLHDRLTRSTVRFTVDELGAESNGDSGDIGSSLGERWPSLSVDASTVAFVSSATNLVPAGTNGFLHVYVKDLLSGAVTLASPGAVGFGGDQDCAFPSLSADGGLLTFASLAGDLVPGDANGLWDVFVYELATGMIERVSVADSGGDANGSSNRPVISSDGERVFFHSFASDLVPALADTNATWDVFMRDRLAGTTELLSVSSAEVQGNDQSGAPTVSRDGHRVAFQSLADNLVGDDDNGVWDVFVRDLPSGGTERFSLSADGGEADDDCTVPSISPDGHMVAFQSPSGALNPSDTNGAFDVFVQSSGWCDTTVATYCAPSSGGCVARISTTSVPNLCQSDLFALYVGPAPGDTFGIAFFGLSGPADLPFGTQGGRICVAGPLRRSVPLLSSGTAGSCDGEFVFTLEHMLEQYPNVVQTGTRLHAQAWFRDPASPDGFGLSDAVWFQTCSYGPGCGGCSVGSCGG